MVNIMKNETSVIDNETGLVIETIKINSVEQLVSDYKTGVGKTVEGILRMSRAVFEASLLKNSKDKRTFFIEANLDINSSTHIKLKAIGERYDFFLKNQNSLPSSWTSLYLLTKIDEEKIIQFISEDSINSFVKGNELKQLVGVKPRLNSNKIVISKARSVDDKEIIEFTIKFQGDQISKVISTIKSITKMVKKNDDLNIEGNEKYRNLFNL